MSARLVVALLLGAAIAGGVWLFMLARPTITDVGPRRVSNQTSQPLGLVGTHLKAPLDVRVRVGIDERVLHATVLDAEHAYVRLPADMPGGVATIEDKLHLQVIDDRAFVDPIAMAVHDGKAYVVSQTTDQLFVTDGTRVEAHPTDDGPRAIAVSDDGTLVIGYAFTAALTVQKGEATRRMSGPRGARAIAVHKGVAYVTGDVDDDLWAIDLAAGAVLWRAAVAPNPRALAVNDASVAVGSEQAGCIERFDRASGKRLAVIAPNKQTRIISGRTEAFSAQIMGGKGVRGLLFDGERLFATSIGPNIGPNQQRMEVTHDGGVGFIAEDRFLRHVGLGAGVPEALASDGKRLFMSDIATGRVHLFDLAALTGDETAARQAWLGAIAIPPPEGTPKVRPDLDAPNRSGNEVHSGPHALAWSSGALWVLDRFTATVAIVDVATKQVRQIALAQPAVDADRRLGQVLYYADLARSGMSCDSCHPDGHMDGVFFEKTRPLRIYRSTTVRGSADTPPYFIPTSTRSLRETNDFVGNRNRFQRLAMTKLEIDALTHFTETIAVTPNPNVGEDGAPKETLTLPDGRTGKPRVGLALFHGKAACATCHPPPLFWSDRFVDVGTPKTLPLRAHLQDGATKEFPPPSLLGAWDVFPMLTSGMGGLGVDNDEQLVVRERFALRDVLEEKHPPAVKLSDEERDDLLAYLLSL